MTAVELFFAETVDVVDVKDGNKLATTGWRTGELCLVVFVSELHYAGSNQDASISMSGWELCAIA
jgi:hypothetical protein